MTAGSSLEKQLSDCHDDPKPIILTIIYDSFLIWCRGKTYNHLRYSIVERKRHFVWVPYRAVDSILASCPAFPRFFQRIIIPRILDVAEIYCQRTEI